MDMQIYVRNIDRETSFERIASLLITWSADNAHFAHYLEDGEIAISPYTSTDYISIRDKDGKLLNRMVYRMNWVIINDSVVPLYVVESIENFINKRDSFTVDKSRVYQWCKDELLMEAELWT